MTSEELQFEIFKLLDSADQEKLSDDFIGHVMQLYGQNRVLDAFVDAFTNDETRHYVTEALKILVEWKMHADGVMPVQSGTKH